MSLEILTAVSLENAESRKTKLIRALDNILLPMNWSYSITDQNLGSTPLGLKTVVFVSAVRLTGENVSYGSFEGFGLTTNDAEFKAYDNAYNSVLRDSQSTASYGPKGNFLTSIQYVDNRINRPAIPFPEMPIPSGPAEPFSPLPYQPPKYPLPGEPAGSGPTGGFIPPGKLPPMEPAPIPQAPPPVVLYQGPLVRPVPPRPEDGGTFPTSQDVPAGGGTIRTPPEPPARPTVDPNKPLNGTNETVEKVKSAVAQYLPIAIALFVLLYVTKTIKF